MSSAFVSHCSADKVWFRRLARAFDRAGVAVWDYLGEERTTIGGPLDIELRQMIASDLVVAIISPASLANEYVAREVATAAASGFAAANRLFTIVLPGTPPRAAWPSPFDQLTQIIAGYEVATPRALDTMAAEILGAVAARYVPAPADPRRLPLLRRTLDELDAAEPTVRAQAARQPQGQFNLLVRTLEDGAAAYAMGDHDATAALLERGRLQLVTFAPGFAPYYIRIAQAVCAMHVGRHDLTSRILEDLGAHRLVDESWHGARGALALAVGRLTDARTAYKQAADVCRARRTGDFEAEVNLAVVDLLLGTMVAALPEGVVDDPEDRLTLACVAAAVRLQHADPGGAIEALRRFPLIAHDDRSLSLLAQALEESDQLVVAGSLLEEFLAAHPLAAAPAPRPPHDLLWRCLARIYTQTGRLLQAVAIYRDTLCGPGVVDDPDLMLPLLEYARLLRLAGRLETMRTACLRLKSIRPRDDAGSYCRGFAAHLLGQHEVAKDLYEQSRGHGRWYQSVLDDEDDNAW